MSPRHHDAHPFIVSCEVDLTTVNSYPVLAPPELIQTKNKNKAQVGPEYKLHHMEKLGLIDRYESIITSVGYGYIEEHVLKTCTGKWAKPILEDLRVCMSEKAVPWMLHVYARGASNRTCYFLFF